MLPASNRGAGMNMGFPDVCNTPAGPVTVPIPYPNIAMNAQAVGFSPIVKVTMVNALNQGSSIPMTSGDEAGVAHPTIKGGSNYTMGNPIVSIDKLPAINLTCLSTGNNMNDALGAAIVPSVTNVMFCRATSTTAELEAELGEAMTSGSLAVAELLPASVGLLRVACCGPELATAVLRTGAELARRGARSLVLDLRGVPGGDLDAALRLAAELLPDGAELGQLVEPDGERTVLTAHGPAQCSLPLVLLIDGGTASAAEVLAAALGHHDRALLVGERSYGKAYAWRLVPTAQGPAPRVAGSFLAPGGQPIQGVGLTPDLAVSGAQAQLDAAWAAAVYLTMGLG